MKLETSWSTCEFSAESIEDQKILMQLYDSLSKEFEGIANMYSIVRDDETDLLKELIIITYL